MVDSVPVPVCKLAREQQLKVCRHDFETARIRDTALFINNIILGISFI